MTTSSEIEAMLKKLRLIGCLAHLDEIKDEPWLAHLITIESAERARRSLENRTRIAGLGTFKPMCDFDWNWPKKIDRPLVEDLFTNRYIAEGANVVIVGPNGVAKTMLLKNFASCALHAGHQVLVRSASDLLADLAGQESSAARARRLRAYVQPAVLCIDEVGCAPRSAVSPRGARDPPGTVAAAPEKLRAGEAPTWAPSWEQP